MCMRAQLLQSCPTLCDPMDCSPPGSSAQGISQARILEWVTMPSSRGSSQPSDGSCVSCISCIAGEFFQFSSVTQSCLTLCDPVDCSEFFTAELLGKPEDSMARGKWSLLKVSHVSRNPSTKYGEEMEEGAPRRFRLEITWLLLLGRMMGILSPHGHSSKPM